ncbi:hypothetical protein Tco_0888767 [Tanacetum coccineum]
MDQCSATIRRFVISFLHTPELTSASTLTVAPFFLMSADAARSHGSNGGGDDHPHPHQFDLTPNSKGIEVGSGSKSGGGKDDESGEDEEVGVDEDVDGDEDS